MKLKEYVEARKEAKKAVAKAQQKERERFGDYVVLHHTLPVFTGLGQCPIVNWDFSGAVSIFGLDALPIVHQRPLPGLEPTTSCESCSS